MALTVPTLDLRWSAQPQEAILTHGRFDLVQDSPDRWPASIKLTGCRFGSLQADRRVTVEERLDWLRHDPDHYQPHPYEELVRTYNAVGDDQSAGKVALEKQRRRRATLAAPSQAVGLLQDVFVGYGYRNSRALGWLLSLLLLGSWVFAHHPPRPGKDPPPFNSWIYTLDLLLPVLSLGQADHFNAQGLTRFLAWALVLLGWGLAAALVAGLTRVVNRP